MIFETGYGPSGLPHIGTWNEVARTSFVRHAYEELTGGAPTRLIAFSDDLDGLRKVPDNVPEQAMLTENLGRPLTRIPDPFGTHASFAAPQQCDAADISSTASASTMSSSRRPTATPRAGSTR